MTFTTIRVTKGATSRRHRDQDNAGPSWTAVLGSGQKGILRTWEEDDGAVGIKSLREDQGQKDLEVRDNICQYDGRRAHELMNVGGEAYEVTAYTMKEYDDENAHLRQQLQDIGMEWPSPEDVKKALTRHRQRTFQNRQAQKMNADEEIEDQRESEVKAAPSEDVEGFFE